MQLWRIDEDTASQVDFGTFESEKGLQDLIERNPEILPIDADLLLLAREFQCGAGVADFVAVDMQTGQLVIIETKLYRNGDRRRVVAQVLDYAADMFDRDLAYLESRVSAAVWESLSDPILDVLADSLSSGDIRLVVVMDQIDDSLRRVARYFQGTGAQFQLDLATVSQVTHDGVRLVTSDLHDLSTASSSVPSAAAARTRARVPHKVTDEVLGQMFALKEQGLSQTEIAATLGLSAATVSRRLRGMSAG